MRSLKHLIALLTLSVSSLAASACAGKERLQPIFPSSADLKAVTEQKPVATPEIVTSAQAAAEYDIAVEAWGERVSRAGGRICRWAVNNGMKLPWECPDNASE